jgi:hypothetical protein
MTAPPKVEWSDAEVERAAQILAVRQGGINAWQETEPEDKDTFRAAAIAALTASGAVPRSTHEARVAELEAELARVREDAGKWQRANATYAVGEAEIRCHVNVGVNVWQGEEWISFHECTLEELDAAIDAARNEGESRE